MMSSVVGYGHAGEKMGPRTGGHGVARVDSDHAECEGVSIDSAVRGFRPCYIPAIRYNMKVKISRVL